MINKTITISDLRKQSKEITPEYSVTKIGNGEDKEKYVYTNENYKKSIWVRPSEFPTYGEPFFSFDKRTLIEPDGTIFCDTRDAVRMHITMFCLSKSKTQHKFACRPIQSKGSDIEGLVRSFAQLHL